MPHNAVTRCSRSSPSYSAQPSSSTLLLRWRPTAQCVNDISANGGNAGFCFAECRSARIGWNRLFNSRSAVGRCKASLLIGGLRQERCRGTRKRNSSRCKVQDAPPAEASVVWPHHSSLVDVGRRSAGPELRLQTGLFRASCPCRSYLARSRPIVRQPEQERAAPLSCEGANRPRSQGERVGPARQRRRRRSRRRP
jgi:hypothetical protein